MRFSSALIFATPFVLAAIGAGLGATATVQLIEDRSQAAVSLALRTAGLDWAEVSTDGLQVLLTGTAPSEAMRLRAGTVSRGIVESTRVINKLDVADTASIAAPEFSIEVLRNDDGVSLIGLVPKSTDRQALVASLTELTGGARVTDLLEEADYPTPPGWNAALAFGLEAIGSLPRSKISVTPKAVEVTATSNSREAKAKVERSLVKATPKGLKLTMDISAPRPVITPFTLRFTIEDGAARFDACSADTAETAKSILDAARAAGVPQQATCTLGLGAPSPSWGDAVVSSIRAITNLGGGSVTFSDADVSLVAPDTTDPAKFDSVVGALESNLPDVFTLHAVLTEKVKVDGSGDNAGPPEFLATLSPEGLVQLRGRVPGDGTRTAIQSFARARFGAENVSFGTRSDDDLPDGWPIRVLAGLAALNELNNGSVVVQSEFIEVRGVSGNPDASAEISRLLSQKLGDGEHLKIDVAYKKELDPIASLPTALECVQQLNAILQSGKINFDPGAATFGPEGRKTIELMADALGDCSGYKMEIGGHTDSQGREVMNLNLSQARADAVLNALAARRVLTSNLSAKGYGETQPIADNGTETGREANRRIEIKLITPETTDTNGEATTENEQN